MRKEMSESSEGGREGIYVEVRAGVFYGRIWRIVNYTEGKRNGYMSMHREKAYNGNRIT